MAAIVGGSHGSDSHCSGSHGAGSVGVGGVRGDSNFDGEGAAVSKSKWYAECELLEEQEPAAEDENNEDDVSVESVDIISDDDEVEPEQEEDSGDDDEEDKEDECELAIRVLEEMGFQHSPQTVRQLLERHRNNLEAVIEELLSLQEQDSQDHGEDSAASSLAFESYGDASQQDVAQHEAYAMCLPASVGVGVEEFRDFKFQESPDSDKYQKEMAEFFTGNCEGFARHNWSAELDSLRQVQQQAGGSMPPPALSVWQAAGYKHAQNILSRQTGFKGCLFWWTPGSGKSIMVALLIELLSALPGKKIVVVSTPQNITENGLKECVRSLLKFSPLYGKGNFSDSDVCEMLKSLRLRRSILIKDFVSFRQFYTQYGDTPEKMSSLCLIIDECHELFNEKLKDHAEIYSLICKAHRVFTLSGTPWRNTDEMTKQLDLLHMPKLSAGAGASRLSSADFEGYLRSHATGCVSYVDGTKDRSNFPINGGWSVKQCCMSSDQLYNFSTRCQRQLKSVKNGLGVSNLHNTCEVAELLRGSDKRTRERVSKACRILQCAGGEFWGSQSSGLCQILHSLPQDLSSVGKLASKFEQLCSSVLKDAEAPQTKHFVYSSYSSTITHLSRTLEALRTVAGIPVFKQLRAHDLEWHDHATDQDRKVLKVKKSAWTEEDRNAIGFVVLRGNVEEKKKLKAAFGYVTPDGQRFKGLLRRSNGGSTPSVPLVQMMLGERETNQGYHYIHI